MAFGVQPINLAVFLVVAAVEQLRAEAAQAAPSAGAEADGQQMQDVADNRPEGGPGGVGGR